MKYWRQGFRSFALMTLALTIWVLFAPQPFGGRVNYVILNGNSMSPTYKSGDMVLVRAHAQYFIGDAVAYRHPQIGVVFHRIIDIDETGRFVLQGDHNTWVDSHAPTQDEILGRKWIHIPRAGSVLQSVRSPWGLGIMALAISMLAVSNLLPLKKSKSRVYKKRGTPMNRSKNQSAELLVFLGVLSLSMLVLGIIAFRKPIMVDKEIVLPYQQQASFTYSAVAPAGVYNSTGVTTGEPIFRRLAKSFAVNLDYVFSSTSLAQVNGTYRVTGQISDERGWKRSLELVPETAFSGNSFSVNSTINLNEFQKFIDAVSQFTSIQRGRYQLAVIVETEIEGTLDGRAFSDTFSPSMSLVFDELEVYLLQPNVFAEENPLTPKSNGTVSYTIAENNTINVLGLKVPVGFARMLSLLLGIPALVATTLLGFKIYSAVQQSNLQRLQLMYGSTMIEIQDFELPNQYIEMANVEELFRLAEQNQTPVLHLPANETHHFFVQTSEQVYYSEMEDTPAQQGLILQGRYPARQDFALINALQGWAQAVDLLVYDKEHSVKVSQLSVQLAQTLGIRGKKLEYIRLGALLHDIGMMDVPMDIIHKPSSLDAVEMETIHQHPTLATSYLEKLSLPTPVLDTIRFHHEHWDGSGYPEGLAGEEIPIGARIVAITEVWNALTTPRAHRPAWDTLQAKSYLQENAGTHFDPKIIDKFLDMLAGVHPSEEIQDGR